MSSYCIENNCRAIIKKIKGLTEITPKIYICSSGVGAGIQKHLWEVPGCSSYFVGASFPYDTAQMNDFLGFEPEKYCSRETAIEIAMQSYYRAVDWNDLPGKNFNIGLGMTGVAASTREHKGGNRVYCSIITNSEVHLFSMSLGMGVGYADRFRDGAISDYLAIYALDKVLNLNTSIDLLGVETEFKHEIVSNQEALDIFMKYPYWDYVNVRQPKKNSEWNDAVFPGAFNPVHAGHHAIAEEVEFNTGASVIYTVSVDNPHKPSLMVGDILKRSKMLQGCARIFTVGEPLYLDKVKNNPSKLFIIGSDALERLLDPKWGPSTQDVLDGFVASSVKFYVATRTLDGVTITLDSIEQKYPVFSNYREHFIQLKTTMGISSSEIRNETYKP